jgi:competence protein ComEC
MEGRGFTFIGDRELEKDSRLRNFHLQPARIKHRVGMKNRLSGKSFRVANRQVLVIDTTVLFQTSGVKPKIDVLILSKNPRLYMEDIHKAFTVKQVIMDGSVPAWKKQLWKKDCVRLGLSYYDVTERGAFEMNLQ